jgi:hypothetical protein
MPPAVIYYETDYEVQAFYHRPDEDLPGGEIWDEELVDPGCMVYVGQGVSQFLRIYEVEPGVMWPKKKKKKKKKKKGTSLPPPPPAPAPALSPAPIDWEDWEELCQAAPPVPPREPEIVVPWEPEDWEAEIAAYHTAYHHEPEDWEAEIAAYHAAYHQREDWEAEIAAYYAAYHQREDWETELSQWQPEDWDAELASQ